MKLIHGYNYYWKDTLFVNNTKLSDFGVIAQEIERSFPSLVHTDKNGIKMVDYYKLIPILIEALKEQNEIIEGYDIRIKKLESKIK
ncbi:MAG: hypothetical protein J7604_25995 [Sporocytophaga sp.]|uniref:tail fiber domain-containing protein n=1 Tax=Sporocytophaga sp. TaxID=2231183 RepID=UPI001B226287|nr:tail fiber domain-containing protein [Sporocytophaga sp.]MBO9703684.1 hypothetical protein [Sporocytophaga sp.]